LCDCPTQPLTSDLTSGNIVLVSGWSFGGGLKGRRNVAGVKMSEILFDSTTPANFRCLKMWFSDFSAIFNQLVSVGLLINILLLRASWIPFPKGVAFAGLPGHFGVCYELVLHQFIPWIRNLCVVFSHHQHISIEIINSPHGAWRFTAFYFVDTQLTLAYIPLLLLIGDSKLLLKNFRSQYLTELWACLKCHFLFAYSKPHYRDYAFSVIHLLTLCLARKNNSYKVFNGNGQVTLVNIFLNW
jgi:hypothetical protein